VFRSFAASQELVLERAASSPNTGQLIGAIRAGLEIKQHISLLFGLHLGWSKGDGTPNIAMCCFSDKMLSALR
jgi:hypothetical protein